MDLGDTGGIVKLAGFCAQCDARYKPGSQVCDECGAPRMIVTRSVPTERLSEGGGSSGKAVVVFTAAQPDTSDRRPSDSAAPSPAPAFPWDLLGTRLPVRGSRVTQALFAALAVAGLGLLLLSTQTVSLWKLLGWAPFVQLMAGLAVMIRAVLPARSNLVAAAISGSAAAFVVASQFSVMTALVPNWVFYISMSAASACVIATILALAGTAPGSSDAGADTAENANAESTPDAAPEGGQASLDSAGAAVAFELLILTCAVTTGGLISNLISGEADLISAATQAAIAGAAGWGLRVLRTGRTSMIFWLVCALLVLPGIANWTNAAVGTTSTLCLITAASVASAQPLRAHTPWSRRRSGQGWTPPVGIGPRSNFIANVITDVIAWLRTGLSAMIAAGCMFWATLLLGVLATLGLVMTPLALLGQVGSYVLATGATDRDSTPAWLIVGLLVAGSALSIVLVSVCAQALLGAVASHDRGGQLRGRELTGRSLTLLRRQGATVARYTFVVLIGAIAGLVPGLILQVRWAFAVPVGASAGLSGSDALRAGWRFTKKRFWRTLLVQIVAFVVTLAFVLGAAAAAVLVNVAYGSLVVAGLLAFVLIALGVTCASVVMASLYSKYLDTPIRLSD